ncbi:hypothetical protein [Paracoccus sp. (in: a-proteobacteria)]|uniref:hypothetical protein n=1 Tax=Paracoccus sp. TaxID=267 RepID=UPI002898D1D5|nr:hypothetical protein [Paracoccus sp. (in: a-proteobacteria)]
MTIKVTFFMGRFGPFEGQLTRPTGPIDQEYKLTFGPLYVNAAALRREPYIHVQKGKRIIVEGPVSGTIKFDPASLATFGDLSIGTSIDYAVPQSSNAHSSL